MIFNEAEDFEIFDGTRRVGRYMVNSQEPWELDIEQELKTDGAAVDDVIQRLLNEGRIVEYRPNFTVNVSLFGDVKEIIDNRDWYKAEGSDTYKSPLCEEDGGIVPVYGLADDNGRNGA